MGGGGPKYEARGREVKLDELVLAPRRERIEAVLASRTRSLTVVLDRLEDSFNMAAVLRTAEAMGVQDVHVIRNPDAPFAPNLTVTQGCDKWLDLHLYPDFASCAVELTRAGFTIWASALEPGARSLFEVPFDGKVALVFGNERAGVSPEVKALAHHLFMIPMLGFVQSLNVSAAASAALTHAVGWRLRHLGRHGDLTEAQKAELRAAFSVLSVKQRGRVFRPGGVKPPGAPPSNPAPGGQQTP